MKKTHEILDKIKELIWSENFINSHKLDNKAFSRNCLITCPILIIFILNLVKRSLQIELKDLSTIVQLPFISKQTFSASRKKLLPTAFVSLNRELINEYYTDNIISMFRGYRLIVVDGSSLQLPESPSIKEKYGTCVNQYNEMPMSRISYAYDPLSGLTLDSEMKPYKTSERTMAFDHVLNIPSSSCFKDLYVFDRGYPSITMLFFLIYHNKDFVMRCKTSWLSEVQKVYKSGKKDVIVEISSKKLRGEQRKEFQRILPGINLNSRLKLRVLIIELSSGEKEVLITSLLDKKNFEYKIFIHLYHQRWSGEENYKFHKVRIEIENFSGKSPVAIEQEFHATVFTANVRALIAREAQEELDEEYHQVELKHDYKINQNIAIGILKNEIMEALYDPEINLNQFCERLKQQMKKSIVPVRLGRKYKRKWKTYRKFPMNLRRSL